MSIISVLGGGNQIQKKNKNVGASYDNTYDMHI